MATAIVLPSTPSDGITLRTTSKASSPRWNSKTRALGHSAGATAIAAVANRRPDLIVRAVLVEPVIVDLADPPNRLDGLHVRTLKRKRVFDSVAAMYHNFEHKPPFNTWRKDILQDYCEFGTRPDALGMRVLKCSPEIESRFYDTARDVDGFALMRDCPVPLILIFGEQTVISRCQEKARVWGTCAIRPVEAGGIGGA
jgi:pimeloyl-ACP methyl ester carboxylesterase